MNDFDADCIGCVKVYLKTKKMTNISQAQAGFKANPYF